MQRNKLFIRIANVSFSLLVVLIVVMGIATFAEQANGTQYTYHHFYGTWWFAALWAIVASGSCITIFIRKIYRNIPVLILHVSFIVILLGALLTRITSVNGSMHLKEKTEQSYFIDESNIKQELPFSLQLISFEIENYPGTQSPSDYISRVVTTDQLTHDKKEHLISMNNILKYKGYRFYQSSFDDDLQGSVLTVSSDKYGIPVTYCGYFMLFTSMLLLLISPQSRFRSLLRNPLLKKGSMVCILLCLSLFSLKAEEQTLSKEKITLSKEQADRFGKIQVLYNGRITSIQTLSIDFTLKLISKNSYKYVNTEQFFSGWLFFPHQWKDVELFEVKDHQLKQILEITNDHACFSNMFDSTHQYKLVPYYKEIYQNGKQNSFQKEALKLDEKIQLINMLHQGEMLSIFPYNINGNIQWYAPMSALPKEIPQEDAIFIRQFFSLYYEAILTGSATEANALLDKLEHFQQKQAAFVIPSAAHQKVEYLSNTIPIFSLLFKINLTLGFIAFIFFIIQLVRSKKIRWFSTLTTNALFVVFLIYSIGFAARWYIAGYLPLSNGYETMLFVGWCSMLIALIFRKYSELTPIFGLLISGFTLLVAYLASMNPQITSLVPVLSSPLLSIHVSFIMFAYALVGFMVLNSLTYFLSVIINNKGTIASREKLVLLNRILLYPTVCFLGAGIFIGAIWANVSWGRYWGWDPKEVWALITFIIAALALHEKIKIFANPFIFSAYIFVILAAVLMTYFGVNFFLGGLHSYAGDATLGNGLYLILIPVAILTLLIGLAYWKK